MQTHPENDPREALVAYLREKGFPVLDLTDNELACTSATWSAAMR